MVAVPRTPPPRKVPMWPSRTLQAVLKQLAEEGYCSRPVEINSDCYVTFPKTSWRNLAKQASKIANGNWHSSNTGLRWENGRQFNYAVASGGLDEILRLRALVEKVTGKECRYSSGSCARGLLSWCFPRSLPDWRDKQFLNGSYIGYHECQAGEYPYAIYYDMKSCYYQLIKRLEHPKLYLDHDFKIRYKPLNPNERSKWNDALEIIADEKLLRNSLWGAMLGSEKKSDHFFDGNAVVNNPYDGHSYAAAALVGRTAWELTRAAAVATDAIYAQTDCVIVPSGTVPNYWNRKGMIYRVKGIGDTHIVGQHRYRVGGVATEIYNSEAMWVENNPRPPLPEREFHLEWL